MTWNEETRLGPPSPTNSRTVSPTLAVSALSPTVEPTDPLNTTYSGFSSMAFCHAERLQALLAVCALV